MKKKKILILEDDAGLQRLISKRLSKSNFLCFQAITARDAEIQIEKENPHLLLLDYKLPDSTAEEFIKKDVCKNIEFIVMTGFGNEKLAVEMMKLGARDYIVKEEGFLELLVTVVEKAFADLEIKNKLLTSEIALRESEEKLRNIFNNTRIGIYRSTPDGKIIMANKAFLTILGYDSVQELENINLSSEEFKNCFDRKSFKELIEKEIEVTGYEYLWCKKDGMVATIRENSKLKKNDSGEVLYYEGTIEDISERVIAEEALRKSEERLQLVLDAANDGIWDWDILADKAYCSRRYHTMLGYEKWELPPKFSNLVQMVHPSERIMFVENIKNHLEGKIDKVEGEFRIKTKSGNWLWVEGKGKVVSRDSEGNPIRMVGIQTDISERKKTEQKLKKYRDHLEELIEERTEELKILNVNLQLEIEKQKAAEADIQDRVKFLRALIDTAPSPIFIKDTNKKYIDCNTAFENYFELKKENLIGQTDSYFLPQALAKKYESIDDQLIENPGVQEYEAIFYSTSGKKKEFIVSKSTFEKSNGQIGGLIAITTDITRRKQLEDNILRALNKERELKEIKTRFVSTASHEFRTPLTTIISSADLLELFRDKGMMDKYYGHIQKIKKSAEQMTELIDDVLLVNKAESMKLEFIPKRINFKELCIKIIDEVKINARDNHSITLDFGLGEEDKFIDPKQLRLVLKNLLMNGIKYSPDGGKILLKVFEDINYIYIEVSDQGLGIPTEDMEELFEPFHRCSNTGNIPGTGLGLSIVKKSVEIQRGIINFKSDVGTGTTFYIKLPKVSENNFEKNPIN